VPVHHGSLSQGDVGQGYHEIDADKLLLQGNTVGHFPAALHDHTLREQTLEDRHLEKTALVLRCVLLLHVLRAWN